MKISRDFDLALFIYSYFLNYYVRRNSALLSQDAAYASTRVKFLLDKEYLCKIVTPNATFLRLTEKGLFKLQKYLGINFPPELKKWVIERRAKEKHPKKLINYGSVMSMINWFVPDLPYEILEFSAEFAMPEQRIFLPRFAKPLLPPSDLSPVEKTKYLAKQKSLQDSAGNFSILSQEFLMMNNDKMKNLAYTRSRGLLRISGTDYFLYNIHACMSRSVSKEERTTNFYYLCQRDAPKPSAIFLGTSYRPVLSYFETYGNIHDLMKFGKNLPIYSHQYFAELNSHDSVALRLLGVPNDIEKLKYALLPAADIQRASSEVLVDGIDENGDLEYVGLLFDIYRIDSLRDFKLSKWISKALTIWCFPWQAPVYYQIFKDNAKIMIVELKDVIKIFPEITDFHH